MPADCLRPIYLARYPLQEHPWLRLAVVCEELLGEILVVDVGANIGDTALAVATLDEILLQLGMLKNVGLIKIDTDCFDYRVIRGSSE